MDSTSKTKGVKLGEGEGGGKRGNSSPGQDRPRQDAGGQASILLVRFPSDALIAVAPSSHSKAASGHRKSHEAGLCDRA